MKILYVITGLGLGGAEKVVVDLADQMYLRGHQVKIAYLRGVAVVKPQSEHIELIPLHLDGAGQLFTASKSYRQIIQTYRPDVVHAHMVHANIFTRINRLFCPIAKLICTAHNSNEGGKIRMLAYRLTEKLSDFNSNVSEEATQALIKKGAFSKDRLKTIYNGIDLQKFQKQNHQKIMMLHQKLLLSENTCVFLSVGRFNEQKDYPNLLHAIALLKAQLNSQQQFKFLIAGDGELRPKIEQMIQQLDLTDEVKLLGRRADIPELLTLADYFVLSSKYEGFGLVVAEAMACQCFVIATDSGGVAEVMGDTGLLVPPQNSEKLAEAMLKALALNNEQMSKNNQAARQRVEKLFSLETAIETWLNYYAS